MLLLGRGPMGTGRHPPDVRPTDMTLTKEKHERWHQDTPVTLREQRAPHAKNIKPFAIGGAFLDWCGKRGWVLRQGRQYPATKEGVRELPERFGIKL
jgi:hypothetical protein